MQNPALSAPMHRKTRRLTRPTAAAGRSGAAWRDRRGSAVRGRARRQRRNAARQAGSQSAPDPVHVTRREAQTTRIARASVGKRARRRRQIPSGAGTSHQ
eukprot:scaffold40359_cov69-Phaeocystis_antarctica.AAC.4